MQIRQWSILIGKTGLYSLVSKSLHYFVFLHVRSNDLLRLQLHRAIYRPDSFVLMSRHCANLKAIRYESTSLNRIVADKSHSVIVA